MYKRLSIFFALIVLSSTPTIAQLTIQNRPNGVITNTTQNYFRNWTGLTPDTLTSGLISDGVIGNTIGDTTLLGAAMCGDTLYRVESFLDVTNNPMISFDGTTTSNLTTSVLADGDGLLEIPYDLSNSFISGEENKVTATFIFTKEYDGVIDPLTGGLKFTVGGFAGFRPGSVMNVRVFNNAAVVIETNGITNSSQCSPLDPAGTSTGGLTHVVEIPSGTPFTKIELDFWKCESSANPIKMTISEFEIPNLSCPIYNGLDQACPTGSSLYIWEWSTYDIGDIDHYNEFHGEQIGGNIAQARMFRLEEEIHAPSSNALRFLRGNTTDYGTIEDNGFITAPRGSTLRTAHDNRDIEIRLELNFKEPLVNPILVFEDIDAEHPLTITDGANNPIQARSAGNELGAVLYDNVIEIMDDEDGRHIVIELIGTYNSIFIHQGPTNARPTEYQLSIVECKQDLPELAQCPIDLYQWKVDTMECQYLLKDANDVFYDIVRGPDWQYRPGNSMHAIGKPMFQDEPVAGDIALLQTDCLQDLSAGSTGFDCEPDFLCFADGHTEVVRIERSVPNGTGYLLDQLWFDANRNANPIEAIGGFVGANSNGPVVFGSQWDDPILGPFSGPIDALGLPTHGANGTASGIAPNFFDAQLGNMGINPTDDGFSNNCGTGFSPMFNLQQDGWLAIPPNHNCVDLGVRNPDAFSTTAVYVIEQDGSTIEVVNARYKGGRHRGTYCINNPHAVFAGGWQLLRVRLYAHTWNCGVNRIHWNMATEPAHVHLVIGNLKNYIDLGDMSPYLYPADNPESLTIPSNLTQNASEIQYAIKDANGYYWEPNGTDIPTTRIKHLVDRRNAITDFPVTDCAGQPAPTTGVTCSEALVTLMCDPIETCEDAESYPEDICTILEMYPSSALADEDCDGGGQTNAQECAAGQDPSSNTDDVIEQCDPNTPAPITTSNNE